MKEGSLFHLLFLCYVLLSGCDCGYHVSGNVVDINTKLSLEGVAIGKTDTTDLENPFNKKTISGDDGEFDIRGIAGDCRKVVLYFSKEGYLTFRKKIENNSTETIYLQPLKK